MSKPKKPAGIRVPAPTLTIIHITMAILLGWLIPLPIPVPIFVQWLGLGFAALGFILGVLALVEFRRVRAAYDPKKTAKSLITSGIYRYTRNPVYLGFVFILIGLPITMGTYWGVILVWSLITFTNNMIIKHEETYLQQEFKNQYLEYSSHVRRWL
jgi:protein-S-isoprenylcysteine O-methyltransferase Ste14